MLDSREWAAMRGRQPYDGNFIPRFEGRLAPTYVDHVPGIFSLSNPTHHLAAFTLYVKLEKAMRIGPVPFRDATLHRKHFTHVKHRRSVVPEDRHSRVQHTHP